MNERPSPERRAFLKKAGGALLLPPRTVFTGGGITNVKDFINSIKIGKPVNNAATAVESNFVGILGRMAAHRGDVVTWDEMLASTEKWEASLKLRW